MASDDENEVGYGKPPKASRFKPGQSGNPKGRPGRKKSLDEAVREMLTEQVEIRSGGKTQKIPMYKAALLKLRNDALSGTPAERRQAIKLLRELAPDFQLEPPAPPALPESERTVTIEIIESDNYGGMMNPTAEEKIFMKEMLHQRRMRLAAGLEVQTAAEPDPLDM